MNDIPIRRGKEDQDVDLFSLISILKGMEILNGNKKVPQRETRLKKEVIALI